MGIHDKETDVFPVENWLHQQWATSNTLSDFLDATDEQLSKLEVSPLLTPTRIYNLASLKHSDKILAIDFDDTLVFHDKKTDAIGQPMPNVVEVLKKLKAEGWKIIINSHRVEHENGLEQIIETLNKYDIPYDEIYPRKPYAEIYIDDKALHFTDWNTVYKQINEKTLDYNRDSIVCEEDKCKMQWIGEKETWVCPSCGMVKFLTKLATKLIILLKRGQYV